MGKHILTIALFLGILLSHILVNQVVAQTFDITAAGELDLESDVITNPGVVSEYFGMNVVGAGESILRVSVGDVSHDDPFEFKLSSTQLFSFLLANDLVSELNVHFRRGVTGSVTVSILTSSGEVQDSATIILNVQRKKSACKKNPSKRVKGCKAVNLDSASAALRRTFAVKFNQSIKGPIVLEP